jgi:EpsI family protein
MPVTAPTPPQSNAPAPAQASAAPKGIVPFWRCAILLGLTLLMLIANWVNPSVSLPQQSGIVMSLPDTVRVPLSGGIDAPFYGSQAAISKGELGILPEDTQLLRKQYDDIRDHESILCTLLLSGAEQRSIHRPEVCLPGQGWTVVGQDNVDVPLASGHQLTVRKLTIQRDEVDQVGGHHMLRAYFMYWFVGENVTTASHLTRVFLSSWDRIFHNRAHRWAYIMVMSPITDSMRSNGLNAAQTQEMMTRFISQVVPSFQKNEMPASPAP